MRKTGLNLFAVILILSLAFSLFPLQTSVVQAVSNTIVISEFRVRGPAGGADEFIELYNLSTAPVSIGGWTVRGSSDGGSTSTRATISAGVTLGPGCFYLLTNSSSSGGPYSGSVPGNQTYATGISDTGGMALVDTSGTIVDQVGMSTGSAYKEGTFLPSLGSANVNHGYERRPGGALGNSADTDNNTADFQEVAPSSPQNLSSPCISSGADAAPSVASTEPANSTSNVPLDQNITVTFSEPVTVDSAWFTLSCSISGQHAADVTGGPTAFTINPTTDFVMAESCTLTVLQSGVTDQDQQDPPDHMAADFTTGFTTSAGVCQSPVTPISQIQGSGMTAAITGTVTTRGVVVGDYEGSSPTLRGFYLQDPAGDGDAATSDGIFVYNGSNNLVSVGQIVTVTGTASDFQGQTQISAAANGVTTCGDGSVEPVDVTLPLSSATDLERYEGMLVRLPQTLTVTELYQLGRFHEVLLSAGGRLKQPTNMAEPGADALALQASNDLNQILVDDAINAQNPDPVVFARNGQPLSAANPLRGGDTTTGVVGVMTYTWGGASASPNAYRVRPINALNGAILFEAANPRPVAPADPGGKVKVVGMNLLNYFNTFSGCTNGVGGETDDCRGANNQAEFDRQWPKTVAAIVAMDPDIIGVNEIENDGYGPTSAIQDLVNKLNDATAPGTYAFIDVDAATGQQNALGTDGIKVNMIYKPARVTPVGNTAVLNTGAFGQFETTDDGLIGRNRPALAQSFRLSDGAVFTVAVNHLKSKGSICTGNISPVGPDPDLGDGQGNCNLTRLVAAQEEAAWLATDPTGVADPDVLIIGDLNSYAKEDPVQAFLSAGYTDLVNAWLGEEAYSYVFDGQWGYLDHALASTSLAGQVAGVVEYHINADEPSVLDYNTNFKSANQLVLFYSPDQYRVSDHDPVIVGLDLNAPPAASAGGPYTVTEGESITLSAAGSDPDGDVLSYAWDLDGDGSFETPGQDVTFAALDGPASVTVQVQVQDGYHAAVAQAVVEVLNAGPVLNQIAAPVVLAQVNTALAFSADFSDAGVLDTHSAVWNWGDGQNLPGTVTEAGGSGTVSDTYAYPAAGIYEVTLTVTDKDGAEASTSLQYVVIYDPNRVVNGMGKFESPAGASLSDPSIAGSAKFSFAASYPNGEAAPTGQVEFLFKAAGLHFNSTSIEWLVVTGTKIQLKGTGTIAKKGDYAFMISAVDGGSSDTFRIIISDQATGEVIYDNEMGTGVNDAPVTGLTYGNIVIAR